MRGDNKDVIIIINHFGLSAVHLAVAGGVFDGVFCAVLFPLDVLDEIWDLIESVSEGFLTYFCLMSGLSWFNWWVSFAPEFQCCYFCESSCLFYLSFNSNFCVSKIMHLQV